MMNPKTLFLDTARSLGLTACGACSIHFSEELSKGLSQTGPVPFAPAELEKRLSPETLLPGVKSFSLSFSPIKQKKRKEETSPFTPALKIITASITGIWKNHKPHEIHLSGRCIQSPYRYLPHGGPVACLCGGIRILRQEPLPHSSPFWLLCYHRRHPHHPSPHSRQAPHPFLRHLPSL